MNNHLRRRAHEHVVPTLAPTKTLPFLRAGLLVLGLAMAQSGRAQAPPTGRPAPAVKLIGKVRKEAIWLRWAVTPAAAWEQANQYGYTIERWTIFRNGQLLPKAEKKTLTAAPLQPLAAPALRAVADTNRYAAAVYAALHGDTLPTLPSPGAPDLAGLHKKSQELELRHGLALIAVDQSFPVAQLAALGYRDEAVKADEQYLYRVYANVPATVAVLDTGLLYASPGEYQPLPKPPDPYVTFGDRTAALRWDYALLQDRYNSYHIERSADGGKTYRTVTKQPLIITQNPEVPTTIMHHADSLAANEQQYHYRIRGIDSFGETGPPSEAVEGRGKPDLAYHPSVKTARLVNNHQVALEWDFPPEGEPLIETFAVIRSDRYDGRYDTLAVPIAGKERGVVLDFAPDSPGSKRDKKNRKKRLLPPLYAANYFVVVVKGKNGATKQSFPVLVQPEDTQPPAAPAGLTASVDSSGVVLVAWQPNPEADLYGYRVFRANTATEELFQLTVSPVQGTQLRDTVPVNTLNDKVYYAVLAVDQRYNASPLTPRLVVSKPSRIPPSAPVWVTHHPDGEAIQLVWINSPSAGVTKHRIYCKTEGEAEWQLIREVPYRPAVVRDSLTDTRVEAGKTYHYTVLALNEAGLESQPTRPYTVMLPKGENRDAGHWSRPKVRVNDAQKMIEISWEYRGAESVAQFWLYRAEDGGAMHLLKVLTNPASRYEDAILQADTTYRYALKAILRDGEHTPFTKEVKVRY